MVGAKREILNFRISRLMENDISAKCISVLCIRSVQIRSYFWSVFSCFGLNTEIYFVDLHIQSEYRKIRTRNNSVFGHFSRSGGSKNSFHSKTQRYT